MFERQSNRKRGREGKKEREGEKKREKEKERVRASFHPLVHFPNDCRVQG